jgi:hypothetical protein
MGSLRERITAYANASADLLTQLNELDELRERVRRAQRSSRMTKPLKGLRQRHRRGVAPGGSWRKSVICTTTSAG